MIAFSCSHCGMKLQVKEQFAGRQSKCPSCKQPLVVPMPSATAAFVPPQQIDGTESSLAKAGINSGVSLGRHDTGQLPSGGKLLAPAPLAGRKNGKERYVIEGEIARGGMGAVLRAIDCDIRREVAVKYMLDAKDPKKQARFVEEAQINGQLEHPNIVPVYDLGIDAQKRPFIMMKMVKGRSLKDVLDQLRDNPKTTEKDYSLGRLLNILLNICNALAFAHSRGVIHRDLKPANIMLGDFGEVYVMDWGLAKVLGHHGQASEAGVPGPTIAYEANQHLTTSRSAKASGQSADADLTQEGSVIGTPAYMPPEQATGNVQAIDARSDVYSLGAILYEMLTLQPPVDKEGGYLSMLMRVMQGEIVPPEQRDPKRTKAGKVPRELAAVAMKAMAKEKEQRYPNVEELQKDIERFQEGRSVSAKEDTKREMIWKFVKRNKGFSAGAALALVILMLSLGFVGRALLETRDAYAAYRQEQAEKTKEQDAKRKQAKDSVPALVRSAKLLVLDKQLDDALTQVQQAVETNPEYSPAHLLKAQLLVARKEFASAQIELTQYLQQQPQDSDAQQLAELCRRGATGNPSYLALAEVLNRQNLGPLAERMTHFALANLKANNDLFPVYQQRVEAAWRSWGKNLRIDAEGKLTLSLNGAGQTVKDLTPLRGMPLTELDLHTCKIKDLSPLQGMKLITLSLHECDQVNDLTPLQGMPLTLLNLRYCGTIRDLTPLKGMPLTDLDLQNCFAGQDLTPLRGMPLTRLGLGNCSQVKDLSVLRTLPLTILNLSGCPVNDLTPLQGMKLTQVSVSPSNITKGIEVLRQMKSVTTINDMPVADFWKKYDAGEFK